MISVVIETHLQSLISREIGLLISCPCFLSFCWQANNLEHKSLRLLLCFSNRSSSILQTSYKTYSITEITKYSKILSYLSIGFWHRCCILVCNVSSGIDGLHVAQIFQYPLYRPRSTFNKEFARRFEPHRALRQILMQFLKCCSWFGDLVSWPLSEFYDWNQICKNNIAKLRQYAVTENLCASHLRFSKDLRTLSKDINLIKLHFQTDPMFLVQCWIKQRCITRLRLCLS